jgi:hypothetical protein
LLCARVKDDAYDGGPSLCSFPSFERRPSAWRYCRILWIGGVKESGVSLVSGQTRTPLPTRKGHATCHRIRQTRPSCN